MIQNARKAGNEISYVGSVRIEVTYFARNTILIRFLSPRDKLNKSKHVKNSTKSRKSFLFLFIAFLDKIKIFEINKKNL